MASIISRKDTAITVRIGRKDAAQLDRIATREGESRTVILRRLVRKGLEDPRAAELAEIDGSALACWLLFFLESHGATVTLTPNDHVHVDLNIMPDSPPTWSAAGRRSSRSCYLRSARFFAPAPRSSSDLPWRSSGFQGRVTRDRQRLDFGATGVEAPAADDTKVAQRVA